MDDNTGREKTLLGYNRPSMMTSDKTRRMIREEFRELQQQMLAGVTAPPRLDADGLARSNRETGVSDLYQQVCTQQFHFEMSGPVVPCHLPADEKAYRIACMREEVEEYEAAITKEDELDALVDLVVFALGTANRHGFHQFAEALDRVVCANMKKKVGHTDRGGPFNQLDLTKPANWSPPDLSDLVQELADSDSET